MVSFGALLLPVLLAAVLVFVVSFLVHMVLGYHASDYQKIPSEDAVRAALRQSGATPQQYIIPHAGSPAAMKSEEWKNKFMEGPVAIVTVRPHGRFSMGKELVTWFCYTVAVSAMVAYVACAALPQGTAYLKVFQVTGATAWLGYAFGQLPAAIWMGKQWSTAAKEVFDGLLYALVTAGAFGWLWPR